MMDRILVPMILTLWCNASECYFTLQKGIKFANHLTLKQITTGYLGGNASGKERPRIGQREVLEEETRKI
jgi:hypothetical protein